MIFTTMLPINLQFTMLARNTKHLIIENFRTFKTTSRTGASHYDVLGITPRATQNDIKSAYYKLSKLYHPDISKGEESAKKFRAITEAYEVLGNINLKKMYDKGLLMGREKTLQSDYKPEEDPTDPTLKFYKSRRVKHIVPTMDGKTPIYDFDVWSKHHYGNILKKNQDQKEFVRKRQERQNYHVQSARQELTIYSIFAIGTLFIALTIYGTQDYDVDNTERKDSAKLQNGVCLEKGPNS